jgi:hypothetical protein
MRKNLRKKCLPVRKFLLAGADSTIANLTSATFCTVCPILAQVFPLPSAARCPPLVQLIWHGSNMGKSPAVELPRKRA